MSFYNPFFLLIVNLFISHTAGLVMRLFLVFIIYQIHSCAKQYNACPFYAKQLFLFKTYCQLCSFLSQINTYLHLFVFTQIQVVFILDYIYFIYLLVVEKIRLCTT